MEIGCTRNKFASIVETFPLLPAPVTPPRFKLERSLTHRLHTLTKITDRATQVAYEQDAGIGFSEGRCLAAIGAFSPLSVNDLARRANLNKAQASRAAQTLVDQGLVDKTIQPQDKRGVVLSLSPSGQAVWQRLSAVIAQRNEAIASCLSDSEREVFSALIDKLVSHAQASTRTPHDPS